MTVVSKSRIQFKGHPVMVSFFMHDLEILQVAQVQIKNQWSDLAVMRSRSRWTLSRIEEVQATDQPYDMMGSCIVKVFVHGLARQTKKVRHILFAGAWILFKTGVVFAGSSRIGSMKFHVALCRFIYSTFFVEI